MNKKILLDLGIVLLLALALVIVFPPANNVEKSLPEGFKTYDYSIFGIKFDYPSDWVYGYAATQGYPELFFSPLSEVDKVEDTRVMVSVHKIAEGEDLLEAAAFTDNCGQLHDLVDREVKRIGGKIALIQKEINDDPYVHQPCGRPFSSEGYYDISIALPYAEGKRYVRLDLTTPSELKDLFLPAFYQMAEHISLPQHVPLVWQVYSNEDLGLSFSHPPESILVQEEKAAFENEQGRWRIYDGHSSPMRVSLYVLEGNISLENILQQRHSLISLSENSVDGYEVVTATYINFDCTTRIKAKSDGEKAIVFFYECAGDMSEEEFNEEYPGAQKMLDSVKFDTQNI